MLFPEGVGGFALRQGLDLAKLPSFEHTATCQHLEDKIGVARVSPRHVGDDSLRRSDIGIEKAWINAGTYSADLDFRKEPRQQFGAVRANGHHRQEIRGASVMIHRGGRSVAREG